MVIPHSRSAFRLSKTQADLKEPFPNSAASSHIFDGSFVNPTTSVDQMASIGRLAGIYMSNDDNVAMSHFLSHCGLDLVVVFTTPCSGGKAL